MMNRLRNWRDVAKQTPLKPMSYQDTKMVMRMMWTTVASTRTNILAKVYF